MTSIALSESQRVLLDGMAMGSILDHVPTPVLVLGNDGTAWLNSSARELDDWLKVDDASRSLMAALGPALQPAEPDRSAEGSPQILAAPLRQKSGAERTYRAILIEVASEMGTGSAAVVLVKTAGATKDGNELQDDVASEITRARLEDAQRQLLQADRLSTIGQLAAGVAHEINNPIGYVQSNLETLRDYVSSLFRLIGVQETVLRQIGAAIQPSCSRSSSFATRSISIFSLPICRRCWPNRRKASPACAKSFRTCVSSRAPGTPRNGRWPTFTPASTARSTSCGMNSSTRSN